MGKVNQKRRRKKMGSAKIQRLELEANEIHYYEEVGMMMKETNIREEKNFHQFEKVYIQESIRS